MPDLESPQRRPARVSAARYRALETLVYPATEVAARARLAGDKSECAWAKSLPGDEVPAWLIEISPGVLSKGRAERVSDAGGEV